MWQDLKFFFNALNLYFINTTARRLECCGTEGRTVLSHGYRKTKKICGIEGENVVAYCHLSSPRVSMDSQKNVSQFGPAIRPAKAREGTPGHHEPQPCIHCKSPRFSRQTKYH